MMDGRCVESMCRWGVILFISVMFLPITVYATPVTICFDVDADGSVELAIASDIDWDDIYNSPDEYNFYSETGWSVGSNGATVNKVSFRIVSSDPAHPIIEFGFAMAAGAEETFKVHLDAPMNVGPLTDVTAYANASAGISFPGKTITGGYSPNNRIYSADYNGSNEFASLIDSPRTGFGSWQDESSDSAEINWLAIPGTVSSIHPEWLFTLSEGAPVNTTSRYEITGVPEPTSILLLGLGGLALLKRRRV